MPQPPATPHLVLGLLHDRPSAVIATITGPGTPLVRARLTLHGFVPLDGTTLVMARIDREEAHYADQAAHALRAEGVTVDITPQLQEEIDTEWTWANYPMPWCSREEIREVSNDAQKIYDDIHSGRLIIHAHADDGWTTVAVGTYQDGPSIHLHGENHLRVETGQYGNPATAIAEFERLYGDAVRPGPAPATSTERDAEQARTGSGPATADVEAPPATAEPAEEQAAEANDHEALLKDFLESHAEWEKWRTWSDETTHAVHESLTLRAEFVHEADPDDTLWTIATYESPVGERLWHATATATTPVEIMRVLLDALASGDATQTAIGSQVSEKTITTATQPLSDSGWEYTVDERWIRWRAPGEQAAGIEFDAFAAERPDGLLPAWTIWGGGTVHQPTWALGFSAHASAAVLGDLTFEMANGLVQRSTATPPRRPHLTTHTQAPAPRPTSTPSAPGRHR